MAFVKIDFLIFGDLFSISEQFNYSNFRYEFKIII